MPESKVLSLAGRWTESSGGCDLNPLWFARNPRYVLVPHEPLTITITLTRQSGSWKRGTSLDKMIGFYLVAADDTEGNVAHPSKATKVEAAFVPSPQVSLTYELRTSDTTPAFVLVPCTWGAAQPGAYKVAVSGSGSFALAEATEMEHGAL